MENNEAPSVGIADKEKHFDEFQNFTVYKDFVKDAAMMDSKDQKLINRVKEMESLSVGKGEKQDWIFFSIKAMEGLLYGYKTGELDFKTMMAVAWDCCLPLRRADQGFHCMGALAAIAIKIKPKPKNAKPPSFPTWVKRMAIELALRIEEVDPSLQTSYKAKENENTTLDMVLKQLEIFNLNIGEGEKKLSKKNLYEWINQYKKENNLPLKNRGPKKKIKKHFSNT